MKSKQKTGKKQHPETVSGRWLVSAAGIALLAAAVCTWGALCVLFWQGSWQLLYHPAATVSRTPANVGVAFDPVGFAATEDGIPQLKGWWIAAAPDSQRNRFTVLYLHGQDGNLSNAVDDLARIHSVGVNIMAFDYRGYGQSKFMRPSEEHWREDVDSALSYLTETRHIDLATIALCGRDLGANLALEMAAAHPELAGVVVESPLSGPMDPIFTDARARLVPAKLLVHDRYHIDVAAVKVKIAVLWFEPPRSGAQTAIEPAAYAAIASRKTIVWLAAVKDQRAQFVDAVKQWIDDLPAQ